MIPIRLWPSAVLTLGRTFGGRGIRLRTLHEIRRKAQSFRLQPKYANLRWSTPSPHPFAVNGAVLEQATDAPVALARAERVVDGEYDAYRGEWRPFPQNVEQWLRNPQTGWTYPATQGWWHTPHLNPCVGDIKDVWEPARFGWVYDLVRGYLVSGDPRYARACFDRFATWLASSPPFRGVQWSCGQETAIRAIALLYAEANLSDADSISAEDRERLAAVLAASGERIADAIGYAVSQRNNHGISEATGLVVLGIRFQGIHPEADRWLRTGRRWLERLIQEQFASDGWYIQHSFTYLRLALDQCIVAEHALRSVGKHLSAQSVIRLRAAIDFIVALIEPSTGILPNHGGNDGALVHPVTLGDYRDFCPILTAACAMFGHPLPSNIQIDQEPLAWLGLPFPEVSSPIGDGIHSGASGWAAARVGPMFVFLRAGVYQSRPGHIDPLHMDVRIHGAEVIVDPGTFAYNAPAPWRNPMVGSTFHNGPIVDNREPGLRGPRFLWYLWPDARLVDASYEGGVATMIAEIPNQVRRVVKVSSTQVEVEDLLLDPAARHLAVRWLLHPEASPDILVTDPVARIYEASEDSPVGWFSPRYGERRSTRVVAAEAPGSTNRIMSRIVANVAERT